MLLGLRSGCGDGDGKDIIVWVEKSRTWVKVATEKLYFDLCIFTTRPFAVSIFRSH